MAGGAMTLDRATRLVRDLLGTGRFDHLRRAPWRGSPNPWAGHCYVACEAVFHLCGLSPGGPVRPACVRVDGVTHWFLKDCGHVHDPTAEQFDETPDYGSGRGKGFLTRRPSRRARTLIAALR